MKITLVDSQPQWAESFAKERDRIREVLGDLVTHVDHIGSTAVPGLAAKPVIDVQVGLETLNRFDNEGGAKALQDDGYIYLQHYEEFVPYRRLFIREVDGDRKCNVHVLAADHPWYQRHTIFRDFLRLNDSARDRYNNAKQELAQRDWESVNEYAGAKTSVVLELEEEAFQHFNLPMETRAWLRTSRVG